MLWQNIEFSGPLGMLVAIAVFVGILWGAYKAIYGLWKALFRPLAGKVGETRTKPFETAFIAFLEDWFDMQRDVFVLCVDADIRCVFASAAFKRMLGVDFENDLKGRRWHRIIKESDLSRTLTKWNEATRNQAPSVQILTFITDTVEIRCILKADPFSYKDKLRYYLIRVERTENTNIRQLEAGL